MLNLLTNRRSIRKFTDTKISKETMNEIINCALLAPSSKNLHPLEFIITEDKATLSELMTCKTPGSTALNTAAAAITVIGDTNKSDVWIEDAAIASIIIQLAAEKLDLGSCWIQIRNRNGKQGPSESEVRKVLNIDNNYGVLSVIALGYKNEEKKPHTKEEMDYSKVHYEKFQH